MFDDFRWHDESFWCEKCKKVLNYSEIGISDGSTSEWGCKNNVLKKTKNTQSKEFSFAHTLSPEIIKANKLVENIKKRLNTKIFEEIVSKEDSSWSFHDIKEGFEKVFVLYQWEQPYQRKNWLKFNKIRRTKSLFSLRVSKELADVMKVYICQHKSKDDNFKAWNKTTLDLQFAEVTPFNKVENQCSSVVFVTNEKETKPSFQFISPNETSSFAWNNSEFKELERVEHKYIQEPKTCVVEDPSLKPYQIRLKKKYGFVYEGHPNKNTSCANLAMLSKWTKYTKTNDGDQFDSAIGSHVRNLNSDRLILVSKVTNWENRKSRDLPKFYTPYFSWVQVYHR